MIEVDGRTVIAHMVAQFPGEHRFVFICNREYLDCPDYDLRGTLRA